MVRLTGGMRMSRMELSFQLPGASRPQKRRLADAVAAVVLSLRRIAHRRELSRLDDRQLLDTGIDPSLAGRRKAAAVSASALRRLQGVSIG